MAGDSVKAQFKTLLMRRCLRATLLSIAIQYLLLTIYLLIVNINFLNPYKWVSTTLSVFCSLYTWFASIPLIGAVIIYGLALCQEHLAEHRYYPTRFRRLLANGPYKAVFFVAHLLVGYLTAWLYTGYLQPDYQSWYYSCDGRDCISSYNIFLLFTGTLAGLYYYVVAQVHPDEVDHATVDMPVKERIRELLQKTVQKAFTKSLRPTLYFIIAFWICGPYLKLKMSSFIDADLDERLVGLADFITNVRVLFYALLLNAQILSNMHLIRRFYATMLAEDLPLVITRTPHAFAHEPHEISVVSALGLYNVYVVQCLAARFLYKISRSVSKERREIFELTQPGNRPANWRALCDQILCIINGFVSELNEAAIKMSPTQNTQIFSSPRNGISTRLMAEKMLLRQYNELHGIRPIVVASPPEKYQMQARGNQVAIWLEQLDQKWRGILNRMLERTPGVQFLFKEPLEGKTIFLLNNELHIEWLTQALAQICLNSLKEDEFGVVQTDLTAIIQTLHRLKCQMDKLGGLLGSASLENTKYASLLSSAERSLFNVCWCFNDDLSEIIKDSDELHKLKAFINPE